MILIFSTRIAAFLVRKGAIHFDMQEICQYGIARLISAGLSFTLILGIAAIFGCLIEGIIFLLCFSPIRRFVGGYHANSYLTCKVIFVITFSICLLLKANLNIENFNMMILCGFIFFLDFIVFFTQAPIENRARPLKDFEKKKYRLYAISISIVQIGIGYISMIFCYNIWKIIFLTTTAVAVAMVVEIIKRKRILYEKENG